MNLLLLPQSAQQGEANNSPEVLTLTDKKVVQHLNTVLQAQPGDTLKVGIRSGRLGTAQIECLSESQVMLSNLACPEPPPTKLNLTIMLALPRPKVLRRLIMDMTAIGVGHIILINSNRTDKSYWQSPMLARLDEFIDDGLMQARDTMPPKITLAKRFKPFVEDELPALLTSKQAVVCHPYADTSLLDYQNEQGLPQLICIGCEGGWVDFELNLLQEQGVKAVSLGRRILRTEAVVNALCGRYL